jgi:hypothetical protein
MSTNLTSSRARRLSAKALLVGMAAAALVGVGAGTAAAGDPEWNNIEYSSDTWYGANALAAAAATGTEYSFVAFRETIKPWDSINIPSVACQFNYLQDKHFSPGRLVPKGVQVVEPGGIGVTITKGTSSGIDSARGQSSATNWAFTNQELVIVLHCTKDPAKAFGGTVDGPSNETMDGVAGILG